jgi:peptide/nickel transport system substrate-binding protein
MLNIILLVFFSECKTDREKETDKTVFRYNEAANITSLDPAFARDQANIWATRQIFNGLVSLDENLSILPSVAYSWEVSDSGRKYTFHLRNDVYFHDSPAFHTGKGRKVKAADFVFSFNRITDEKMASPGSWIFNYVKRQNGECMFSAIDDSTFTVCLEQPFPPFLGLLTTVYGSAVPHEAISYYADEFRKNPVGSGPFMIRMWKEGVKLVLVKNPAYFEIENGKRLPYLDAVSITFLSDKQSAFLEFMKGRLDFMSGIDVSYKDELLTKDGHLRPEYIDKIELITQPYLNTEYLAFLVDQTDTESIHDPVKNKNIRQAINYSFDRFKMIQYLRNNIGTPGTSGIIPRGLPSYDSTVVFYDYSPQKASRLLAEAGYPHGNELPEITLTTTADYVDMCKYIQRQAEEIGIDLKIDVIPPAALKEMKAQAKLPFFRASWIADYPDAENYLSLFHSRNFSPKGPNYTHFTNRTFDELYERAMRTINDSVRFTLYKKMDSLIMEEAPVVILYYDQVLRFVHRNITGLGSDPMNMLTLKHVRKIKH